jgi:hypothetical protein
MWQAGLDYSFAMRRNDSKAIHRPALLDATDVHFGLGYRAGYGPAAFPVGRLHMAHARLQQVLLGALRNYIYF